MPRLVFDPIQFRPACPILQAAMGGDPWIVSIHFDPDHWLIAPTPGMRVYDLSDIELQEAAEALRRVRR